MAEDQTYTAKDAKDLAGVSYRQLNDWDSRGAVAANRDAEGGWRKFSPKQIFALMVCNEIRRLYGTPVERLGYVKGLMMQQKANHLLAAVELMEAGLHVFLLTDLEETFVIDSDLEFVDYMRRGYFRAEGTKPYIFLRVNEIVNRLLATMTDPVELKPQEQVYRAKDQVEGAITVRTLPEFQVLRAIRSGQYDRIEVEIANGLIRRVNAEGMLGADDFEDMGKGVTVKAGAEFEDIVFKRRDGKIVNGRRSLPTKFSAKDNVPFLFAIQIKSGTKQTRELRDGEQPSDSANSETKTRRDRKPLSREDHGAHSAHIRGPDAQPRKMPKDPGR